MKQQDRERGATLVEYALLGALVLVVSIGAIAKLQTTSKGELASDGVRVGSSSDNAYYPGVSTTTTAPSGTTTTTTGTIAVHPSSITATPAATDSGSKWIANVTVTIRDSTNAPVAGILVTGTWDPSSPPPATGSCTTSASGTCSLQRTDINDNKSPASFTITAITGTGYSWTPSGGDVVTVSIPCSPPLTSGCD